MQHVSQSAFGAGARNLSTIQTSIERSFKVKNIIIVLKRRCLMFHFLSLPLETAKDIKRCSCPFVRLSDRDSARSLFRPSELSVVGQPCPLNLHPNTPDPSSNVTAGCDYQLDACVAFNS